MFDKENDPSVLLAPSAGKLIGYVVEDGAEIGQNEVYAELEVMKMVMQVKVARAGKLIHEKNRLTVDSGNVNCEVRVG